MPNNEEKRNNGELDPTIIEEMRKQVDVSLSSAKEMRRVELNFMAELVGVLQKCNKALDDLFRVISIASTERIKHFLYDCETIKKENEAADAANADK